MGTQGCLSRFRSWLAGVAFRVAGRLDPAYDVMLDEDFEVVARVRQGLRDAEEYGSVGWYGFVELDDVRELVIRATERGY